MSHPTTETEPETLLDAPIEEETLVAEARHALTPSECVERKLVTLLKTAPLPVSQSQTFRLRR